MSVVRIGLIGDHDPAVLAHRAIPLALERSFEIVGSKADAEWLATADLARDPGPIADLDGVWCIPASPYASGEAAIAAIRWAREGGTPFLGTCGGYQHALLEFARHV